MASIKTEVIKVLPFGLTALIFLYDSPNWPVIAYAVGLVLLFASVTHVVRKVTFWGLSIDRAFNKALQEPLAAAVVFSAIVYFMATAFEAMVGFFR